MYPITSEATLHSLQRAKERCNLKNPRSAANNIQRALARGKRAEDCTSWERAYLSLEAYDNCSAIAYNNFCYIFNEKSQCVTIHSLPCWFGKKKRFDGKIKIRNYKRYCACNSDFIEHG